MLDLKTLVADPAAVEASLRKRCKTNLIPVLSEVVAHDKERRESIQKVELLKARRNVASQEIAKSKKEGKDSAPLMEEMKKVATEIKSIDERLAEIEGKLQGLMYEIPNLLHASVPEGADSAGNVEVRRWGNPKELSFPARTHDEIGEKMGILDFKKAGDVTGARFVFLKGLAAKLERGLIRLMLETHAKAGYEEMLPPFLVNRASLTGTGQLPKFEEDVFHIEKHDYFLIPTAEVPVTNYHRNEILEEKDLPKKYTAYTPCFRSEAGSYGKDTKGMKRQHQFNKVELVKFVKPENSFAEHEALTLDAEKILQMLELPYRVMTLCGGDTGFNATKTYDIEVWSPASKSYMEISSCSNFIDYQARRANIRYRDSQTGKVGFVHTLNGSGLAVGRTLLAIMENFQNENGTFEVPDALQRFL